MRSASQSGTSDAARRIDVWCATWPCEKSESACARGERSSVPWKPPPEGTRTSAAQHSQLSPQRAADTPAAAATHAVVAVPPVELRHVYHAALRHVEKSRRGTASEARCFSSDSPPVLMMWRNRKPSVPSNLASGIDGGRPVGSGGKSKSLSGPSGAAARSMWWRRAGSRSAQSGPVAVTGLR